MVKSPGDIERKRNVRRHREIRSSLTGPFLANPKGRVLKFRRWAEPIVSFFQNRYPQELGGVEIGFASSPASSDESDLDSRFYRVDKKRKQIIFFRIPIQRFTGLHVNDDEHRRLFLEHTVYMAICEYLEADPWQLMPGYFEHY